MLNDLTKMENITPEKLEKILRESQAPAIIDTIIQDQLGMRIPFMEWSMTSPIMEDMIRTLREHSEHPREALVALLWVCVLLGAEAVVRHHGEVSKIRFNYSRDLKFADVFDLENMDHVLSRRTTPPRMHLYAESVEETHPYAHTLLELAEKQGVDLDTQPAIVVIHYVISSLDSYLRLSKTTNQ
jgi:hypothetical protein